MRIVPVFLAILALIITIQSTGAYMVVLDSEISVDHIDLTIYKDTDVDVLVKNNLDAEVSVSIEPNGLTVSDTSFTLQPHSSKTITYTLNKDFNDSVIFSFSWDNMSKLVKQFVRIDYRIGKIRINKNLVFNIYENKYERRDITIRNDGDAKVSVEISYTPSDSLISIYPEEFTLGADSSKILTYIVCGKSGENNVKIDYTYGDVADTIEQNVIIKTKPSPEQEEIRQKIKEYKDRLKQIDRMMLNGTLKVNVDDMKVGEQGSIQVKLDNTPADAIARIKSDCGEDFVFISGSGYYTPRCAGKHLLQILNAEGEIKYETNFDVSKREYNLTIADQEINNAFKVMLPEEGKLTIKGLSGKNEDRIVFDEDGKDEYKIVIDDGGKYRAIYDSTSYHGSCDFYVRGAIDLCVKVDGKKIPAGGKIPSGNNIEIFLSANGEPVDKTVIISLPASALGYSKQEAWMITQQQMWYRVLSGKKIIPSMIGTITMEYRSIDGKIILPVKECEGLLYIYVEGDKYVDGVSATYKMVKTIPMMQEVLGLILLATSMLIILYKKNLMPDKIKEGIRSIYKKIFRKESIDFGVE